MFLRPSDSWSNWNEMLVFEKRGKPPPGQKEKTSNKHWNSSS